MTTLNDLGALNGYSTVREWHNSFTGEDWETLQNAFMTGRPADVFPIISRLDQNPFPFGRSALAKHMREVKEHN